MTEQQMQTEAPAPDWLGKADAAAYLGVGVRQIEKREARGQIEKRVEPRKSNQSASTVLYARRDLDAIKHGVPNQYGVPVPDKPPARTLALATTQKQTMPAHVETGRPGLPPVFLPDPLPRPVKPWLTLAEAAEYSGLPEAFLARLAKEGAKIAINVGAGKKNARWRFNREALGRIGE
jgi:hypothetical protein